MTFAAADPVSSGRPYRILETAGGEPSALEQFLGETSFTISKGGGQSQICGQGTANEMGVRFQEKEVKNGKDVRTWQLTQEPEGGFTATPTAAF
jgi:hypothetical protein